MKATTHQALCFVLISITIFSHVNAAVMGYRCDEVPCVDNFTSTCEEVVLTHDFGSEGCCFSLSDDVSSGGCLVSIEGNSTIGSCYIGARMNILSVEENGDIWGLAGGYVFYHINGTLPEECPASDYEVESSSQELDLPTGTMTLEGVMTEWTEQDTADWIGLTENHTVAFFIENPEYGYRDVLTYIKVYPNVGVVSDTEAETQTLTYLQVVTFRVLPNATDLMNSTVQEFLDLAFNTPAGYEMYMATLQNSSNRVLSAVSNFYFDSLEALPNGGNNLEANSDAPEAGAIVSMERKGVTTGQVRKGQN